MPVITTADFCVDDDDCGVTSLLDSFATSADQERLREKAIRNLQAIHDAGIHVPPVREVISSLWMRSLSATQDLGGTRNEVQLDITRQIRVSPSGRVSVVSLWSPPPANGRTGAPASISRRIV